MIVTIDSAAMIELFLLQRRSLSWHRLSIVSPTPPSHERVCHHDIHLQSMTESTTMISLSCCNDTVSGAAVIEMMESGPEPGKNARCHDGVSLRVMNPDGGICPSVS